MMKSLFQCGTIAFCFACAPVAATAQDDSDTANQIALLEQQNNLQAALNRELELEAARLKAELDLLNAQNQDPELAAQLELAKLRNSIASEDKAAAEAKAAALESNNAAALNAIAGTSGSGVEGKVTLGDGAGKLEAALLSSRALTDAAELIKTKVVNIAPSGDILVVGAADVNPDASLSLALYEMRVRKLFEEADGSVDPAKSADERIFEILCKARIAAIGGAQHPSNVNRCTRRIANETPAVSPEAAISERESFPIAAAATTALTAGRDILSFFKTDYELRGTTITPNAGRFQAVVAGALSGRATTLEAISWMPRNLDIVSEMEQLEDHAGRVRDRIHRLERWGKEIDATVEDGHKSWVFPGVDEDTASSLSQTLLNDLKRVKITAENELKTASESITNYNTFLTQLSTPDSEIYVKKIINSKNYEKALSGGPEYVLKVTVEFQGGSSYTKENVWTGLGGMPFEAAGGAVANYVLIRPSDGVVLASDYVGVHGGYMDIDEIQSLR